MAKGARPGSKHHFAKLTEELVYEARVWYYDDPDPISIAELSRLYGVSPNVMANAVKGITWKHVKKARNHGS